MKKNYLFLLLLSTLSFGQTTFDFPDAFGTLITIYKGAGISFAGTAYPDLYISNSITDNAQLTNGSGYTTATSTNTFTNKTGNISQWTNNAGYLTAEVDGSITNEIELPAQTSQSGKVLSTNGTSPNWVDVTVNMSAPSYNNSITSGTAFQPSSTNASQILISSVLGGGVLGLSGTSIISMCSTQSGTYTNIGNGTSFYLAAASLTDNKDSAAIPVPKGYWVKVTNTAVGLGATLTSTYSKWNL